MNTARTTILVALAASASYAAPVQTFGGEFAVGDGSAGFAVDVNADGFLDLNFAYFGVSVNSVFGWDGVVRGSNPASDTQFSVATDENGSFVHNRINGGELIGPGTITGQSFGAIAYEVFFDDTSGGEWLDMEPGFVAFSFLADGDRHYGWAEVEIDNAEGTDDGFLVLYRIGYETTPDTPIPAGAPLGCGPADLAEPFGTLNFFDLGEFLTLFNKQDPLVDLAAPFGVFNFFDLGEFLTLFNQGCP